MLAARVSQHRLCCLRATATESVIEPVDVLDMRARFTFQNYTASFAAFDVVHDSSPLFPSMQPMCLTTDNLSAYTHFQSSMYC